jgi:hypothetical protein
LAMVGEVANSQPQGQPFYYGLNPYKSPVKVTSPTYTLSDYTPEGVVTEATPLVLQPGWNLITRIVDGARHSWLVGYNAASPPPPPQDGTTSYQIVGGVMTPFVVAEKTSGSTIAVTGTSTADASQETITIIHAGIAWEVKIGGNGLYVTRNGVIVQTLLIPASTTYSFDLELDTSLDRLGVVVNGTEYL